MPMEVSQLQNSIKLEDVEFSLDPLVYVNAREGN